MYNKDYHILGSILGSPYFGKQPYSGCRETIQELGSSVKGLDRV